MSEGKNEGKKVNEEDGAQGAGTPKSATGNADKERLVGLAVLWIWRGLKELLKLAGEHPVNAVTLILLLCGSLHGVAELKKDMDAGGEVEVARVVEPSESTRLQLQFYWVENRQSIEKAVARLDKDGSTNDDDEAVLQRFIGHIAMLVDYASEGSNARKSAVADFAPIMTEQLALYMCRNAPRRANTLIRSLISKAGLSIAICHMVPGFYPNQSALPSCGGRDLPDKEC